MADHSYKVGDTVFVRTFQVIGDGYEATIEKIGRKWATLSGRRARRFNLETGSLDGGAYTSPGKVYPSRDAFFNYKARLAAWSDFLAAGRCYDVPEHLTLADIQSLTAKISTPITRGDG